MDFDSFVAAIRWTQTNWNARAPGNPTYQQLRAHGNAYWSNLHQLPRATLENNVIRGFLNSRTWCCHLPDPAKPNGVTMVNNLQAVLNQLPARYAALHNARIENPAAMADQTMLVVASIYHDFRRIRPIWGPVPSSKLMHFARPELLMMWDDDIIKTYGVPREIVPGTQGRKRSYIAFLLLMHEYIQHIRETSPGGADTPYPAVFDLINQLGGYAANPLPITRLLDMANYAVSAPRRRGMVNPPNIPVCEECRRRADTRLAGLAQYDAQFNPGHYGLPAAAIRQHRPPAQTNDEKKDVGVKKTAWLPVNRAKAFATMKGLTREAQQIESLPYGQAGLRYANARDYRRALYMRLFQLKDVWDEFTSHDWQDAYLPTGAKACRKYEKMAAELLTRALMKNALL